MLLHLDKNRLHHAYLIEGEKETILPEIEHFLRAEYDMKMTGHPDVSIYDTDNFALDDAYEMRARAQQTAFYGGKKFFIVTVDTIQLEAQNALLKTFEEPTVDTHFFIVVPNASRILPTLLSRVRSIDTREENDEENNKDVSEFLRSDIPDRMSLVGKIITKKDKERARALFDGVIAALHATSYDPKLMQSYLNSRSYIDDRSASLKILLEHLAMTYPSGNAKS